MIITAFALSSVPLGVGMLSGVAFAEQPGSGFFNDIPDLPIMPGLIEDIDASVVFDRPEGRIVEAAAAGPLNALEIAAFYQAALPSLGWQASSTGALDFTRGAERLRLEITPVQGGNAILRLSIEPKGS